MSSAIRLDLDRSKILTGNRLNVILHNLYNCWLQLDFLKECNKHLPVPMVHIVYFCRQNLEMLYLQNLLSIYKH